MHVVLGGTGRVGSAVAKALIDRDQPVTIVTREPSRRDRWIGAGARVAVADVRDTDALRCVFRSGTRLFLLNPPADPSGDTDAAERTTVASIVAALEGSGLEKIVAQSTYGAQPGERCGDSSILYELEQALRAQPIPVGVVRAAYYMSNWDASLATAQAEGIVNTFYPADFELPMVAPRDLGQVAARLLVEPAERAGLHHVEGPQRYSPADVAAAFQQALRKPVEVVTAPRQRWKETFEGMGFSEPAAEAYTRMTAVTADQRSPMPSAPIRGPTSLQDYVFDLVGPTLHAVR